MWGGVGKLSAPPPFKKSAFSLLFGAGRSLRLTVILVNLPLVVGEVPRSSLTTPSPPGKTPLPLAHLNQIFFSWKETPVITMDKNVTIVISSKVVLTSVSPLFGIDKFSSCIINTVFSLLPPGRQRQRNSGKFFIKTLNRNFYPFPLLCPYVLLYLVSRCPTRALLRQVRHEYLAYNGVGPSRRDGPKGPVQAPPGGLSIPLVHPRNISIIQYTPWWYFMVDLEKKGIIKKSFVNVIRENTITTTTKLYWYSLWWLHQFFFFFFFF